MSSKRQDTARRGGALVLAFAAVLGLVALFGGSAGAQTSGNANADSGSVSSGNATATGGSTASGDATAANGSTASGCSTAINQSTASGGNCETVLTTVAPTTTVASATTTTTTGGTTVSTAGGSAGGTSSGSGTTARLAATGSDASGLAEWAIGLTFIGLVLVSLGFEAPVRDQQA